MADAVRKVWRGPVSPDGERLWYGPNKGASFFYVANAGSPFFVADNWVRYFVTRDPGLDTTHLTYRQFFKIFRESQKRFHSVIGSDDPDLSAFARAGGKLLSYHGQSDELVPTQGTVDYRKRVNRELGGNARVDNFYRLFLLPGVNHCAGGPGPQPTRALEQLVDWVENGHAPATLDTAVTDAAGQITSTRQACRYPQVNHYDGHGDPASASSYRCISG